VSTKFTPTDFATRSLLGRSTATHESLMSNIYLVTNRLRWSGDTQRPTKVSRPPIDTPPFRLEIRCCQRFSLVRDDDRQTALNILARVMLVFVGARLHLEITNKRRKVVHSTPRLFTVVAVKSTVRCSLGLWRLLGLTSYLCRAAALKPHVPPTF
jgi:hypothetical protein